MPIDPFEGVSAVREVVMRVRLNVVLTGALVAIALGAPFALPRLLDSHGSAGVALRAIAAPLVARNTVVEMPALPARKHEVHAPPPLVRVTPRVATSSASLASVRTRVAPEATVPTAIVHRWFRHHR